MSCQLFVISIDWNTRTAGLALEPDNTQPNYVVPFSGIEFPKGWTCGEPECGLLVRLSWEFERGYPRGHFPGRCKARRAQGVDSPDRRQMRQVCEGKLTHGNRGSRRNERRWVKRIKAEAARVKQGLLPRVLRP